MRIKNRKSLFLASTILRGRLTKDDNAGGGAIEVGPGFAPAPPEGNQGDGNNGIVDNSGGVGNSDDGNQGDDGGQGEGDDGNQGEGEGQGEGDDGNQEPPKKRKTAEERVRESRQEVKAVKGELREEKAARLQLEQRLAALESGGLTRNQPSGNQQNNNGENGAPDPSDLTKFPLGFLDPAYVEEKIAWTADKKVKEAIEAGRRRDQAQTEAELRAAEVANVRKQADAIGAKGSELFDDYEEFVLDRGMRGDFDMTETTFKAAHEADHGAEILHMLASDTTEAARVAKLSDYQQLKYVEGKNAEISAKRAGRTKPKAGDPPRNTPAGRNGSAPIRLDTDNLDDFRKIYYPRK